jgi:hypothetical protein
MNPANTPQSPPHCTPHNDDIWLGLRGLGQASNGIWAIHLRTGQNAGAAFSSLLRKRGPFVEAMIGQRVSRAITKLNSAPAVLKSLV